MDPALQLPPAFEIVAICLWSISGGLVAARRGYDISGIFGIALVASLGGGLIRDGIFLQQGPPMLVRNPLYLGAVGLGFALVILIGRHVYRIRAFPLLITLLDSLGIGTYAVVGMQQALDAGINPAGAVLVGIVTAVGGGLLRDILMRQEPMIFKPGQPTALAAMGRATLYYGLSVWAAMPRIESALFSIAVVFLVRVVAVRYRLSTKPLSGFDGPETGP